MTDPSILIHAGAGPFAAELRGDEPEVRQVLADVLGEARGLLELGADALGVAVRCVELLEDCELFNAGRGSALCADGSVQMSAAAMRGVDRAAGAVAGVRTVRNPIRAAERVLAGDQVLMIGADVDELARAAGLESLPNDAFVTDRERARLERRLTAAARGTVGAVCLDAAGGLAAATSTGGISGQPPGRVGDSPLIGAGTWADGLVAVSCTGDGEAFIRAGAAFRLAGLVAGGTHLADAADLTLAEVAGLGGHGGLIALRRDGSAALPHTTPVMPRGRWRAGEPPTVWIGPG